MERMFQEAKAFDQNLGWCLSSTVDMDDAFLGTKCLRDSCGVKSEPCA